MRRSLGTLSSDRTTLACASCSCSYHLRNRSAIAFTITGAPSEITSLDLALYQLMVMSIEGVQQATKKLGSTLMVDGGFPDRPKWTPSLWRGMRADAPLLLALALVGTVLSGLLVGYEPVGGDPDRLYRPLKSELARALREGRLPFWSSRFGLGVPLVAESHVAAFYPPNLLLYSSLDLSLAYRLSMWLHYVAVVGTTYVFACSIGLSDWGSALAGVAFALCGFQAIHSSHEPFYRAMPYLPLALWLSERYLGNGRILWLALLALCLGVQWFLGHFQIQTWTGGLVILTAMWRAALDRRAWRARCGVIVGTACGAALAAVQLGLSWQLASAVGQTGRSSSELIYYSYPPSHWFEVVVPRLVRELRLGPEDPYWFGQQTWGYEAALYVGTIPVILAFVGLFGRPASRSAALWRLLVPVSFALATMPRWWPQGYLHLLSFPGIGFFRAPGEVYALDEPRFGNVGRGGIRSCDLEDKVSPGTLAVTCLRRLRCGRCMVLDPAIGRPSCVCTGWNDRRIRVGRFGLAHRAPRRLGLAVPKTSCLRPRDRRWRLSWAYSFMPERPNGAGRSYFRGKARF